MSEETTLTTVDDKKELSCPMCTQAMAFNASLNKQLSSSVILTQRKGSSEWCINFFVSTKEQNGKKPENIGGTAYGIKYCPWCGRKL